MRPINLLMIAFFFILAYWGIIIPLSEVTSIAPNLSPLHYALLVLDVILVCLYGYLINDVFDHETDAINKPSRLIPSGLVSREQLKKTANYIAITGFFITLFLGYFNHKIGWITLHPLCVFLLYWYASNGKRIGFLGNILVSVLIASFPFLILLSVSDMFLIYLESWPTKGDHFLLALGVLSGLMFTTNLVREVIKDIEDEQGDKLIASRALIHLWPLKQLKVLLIIGVALIVVLQGALTYLFGIEIETVMLFMVVFLGSIMLFFKVKTGEKPYDFKVSSKITKAIMLIGMLELILFARLV